MGGLIVSAWAIERRPQIDGLVVSSPALSVDAVSPFRLRLLRWLRRIRPRASMRSELDPEGLSRDPAVVEAYLADPLVKLEMTLSLAAELFGAMERTAPSGGELRLPTLLVQGEDDPICSPAASERFAREAPDCRYLGYPGLRHEIFNEPEQETVFADVQGFLEEIEGRGASAESA
jgi:alpha-beta hydrolase superfamily lysophospholipase